ncbi:hypothetical protein EDC55_10425 [Allofrancisella inopinata]|uniref:Uncharacterized protein n=1 Tax=Allofrancisella inopinata TaxID=1085647 RepID=A0AAE6YI89_9GAMM|nr:hypothetical protein [Allofrancisella inopinata]QIV96373.1 hypothetical protein E4K63_05850 [Allofrancisella inopinata]TDT73353.1 hypothetical protein EDC55_10425 [Allofrancisella inopinata]
MGKFRKAVYISFSGETRYIHQNEKSFFYQKDRSVDRTYEVNMHTQDYKRRQLFNTKIPFVRINFPFIEKGYRFEEEKYNLDKVKSNNQIAREMIGVHLSQLEPNSIIYVEGHGNKEDNFLTQEIKVPKKGLGQAYVEYKELADILESTIPVHARHHLQIRLYVCNATLFAKNLMSELHEKGFKSCSVVAYNETLLTGFNLTKPSKNVFNLGVAMGESRRKYVLQRNWQILRKRLPDNKIAYHNYGGELGEQPYREFKKQYMSDNERIKYGFEGLSSAQEEVILLQNTLFQSVAPYIDNYEKSFYHGVKHRHGSNGHKRIRCFCERINSISTESIVENKITPEIVIEKIFTEIKSFANKTGDYSRYSGNININDSSGMTFILKGLNEFCKLHRNIVSEKLKLYLCNIIKPNNFKKRLEYEFGQPSFVFLDLQDKANRQYYLNNIQNLDL